MNSEANTSESPTILVPASHGWPMMTSFGLTLITAGLVTHWLVSCLGAFFFVIGLVGWFREVLPHEAHEPIAVEPVPDQIVSPVSEVMHLRIGEQGHRAQLPLQIYPYAAGIRGGLVAGAVTVVLAVAHGLITQGSIWYTGNLLAATGSMTFASMTVEQLRQFHPLGTTLAILIHGITCVLVGLLYGISLPMFPRYPILMGGILVPIFWTGLLYSVLGILDPIMQGRIDWIWFMVVQVIFGLIAGYVVSRHVPISTLQHLPFAMRAGMETQGLEDDPE